MSRLKPQPPAEYAHHLFARRRASGLIEAGTRGEGGVELASVADLREWVVLLHAAVAYADTKAPPLRTSITLRVLTGEKSGGAWPTPCVLVRGRGTLSHAQACDLADAVGGRDRAVPGVEAAAGGEVRADQSGEGKVMSDDELRHHAKIMIEFLDGREWTSGVDERHLASARRLLELLPPADDAEPVTGDWLKAVGGEPLDADGTEFEMGDGCYGFVLRDFSIGPKWYACYISGDQFDGSETYLAAVPTRYHVRRLAMALGIALTEPV
jgi:hypothetical protein